MLNVAVTKNNGELGILLATYTNISNYSITDDYLILNDDVNKIKTYIKKDQVLEFEVHYE